MKPLRQLFILGYLVSVLVEARTQDLKTLPKQKPFDIRGNLSIGASYYQSYGINNRRQPFYWFLSGAPTISILGVSFPFSITVSEQERRFSQPFNQYGASPHYKWLKLHVGYRNVRFSDYTLAGASFLGGGVEINPGLFRLGVVYGRFARAVAEDPTAFDPRIRFIRPAYKRMGYGAKIGVGNANNFFDIAFFKATDQLSSIPPVSANARIHPQDNLTVGVKSQFGMFQKKLFFDLDFAASALTRDLSRQAIPSTTLPAFLVKQSLLSINSSTSWFTAGHISTRYSFDVGSLRLMYKRIDPNYQSLGAYYFQNDMEQLTIEPTLSLMKGKLSMSGSYGLMRDNLGRNKFYRTNRTVGALSINAMPARNWNVNLNYANFGVSQTRAVADTFNDSTAVSLINASYGGNITYSNSNKVYSRSISLFGAYQTTNDQNIFTRDFSNATTLFATASFSQSFIKTGSSLGGALSFSNIQTAGRTIRMIGPNLNLSMGFLERKLRTGINTSCQFRQANSQKDGLTASTSLNVSYRVNKQSITISGNHIYNRFETQKDGLAFRDFHEFRTSLSYGISFGR